MAQSLPQTLREPEGNNQSHYLITSRLLSWLFTDNASIETKWHWMIG
jgi:hypothetical protein